jgi:hypothetical protein
MKIDKGIEKPKKHAGQGRRVYPWHLMAKGDSIKVKNGGFNLASAASRRYAPKKFESAMIAGVHRVWRTA